MILLFLHAPEIFGQVPGTYLAIIVRQGLLFKGLQYKEVIQRCATLPFACTIIFYYAVIFKPHMKNE
jgi:hypothetical protein